jgi:hypothetical protein
MRTLNRLDVQDAFPVLFKNCSVLAVSQRARLAVAQPRNVVLVPAEILRCRSANPPTDCQCCADTFGTA